MTLEFEKISDTTNDNVTALLPAFWTRPLACSQAGTYVTGCDDGVSSQVAWLADTSLRPPVLKWAHRFDDDAITIVGTFRPVAVDDEGSVWGSSGNNDGYIIEVPLETQLPQLSFSWADFNGKQHGLAIHGLFALTASDGTIKLVLVPGGTTGHDNTLCFLGTKGEGTLTEFDMGTWVVWQAFIDDNDDIWVAGAVTGGADDKLKLKRLTDVTGSSPYSTPLSLIMPASGRLPQGFFSAGHYVGGWVNGDDDKVYYYFNVNLTAGTATTRDVSAAPVYTGFTIPVDELSASSFQLTQVVPPNPEHYFFWDASDDHSRIFKEIKSDMTDGVSYNLDSWSAGDLEVDGDGLGTAAVQAGLYLDGQLAFAGSRHFDASADDNQGDLFIYYFGDAAADGNDDDILLRVWGASLDTHDFFFLRLGNSETLTFDLSLLANLDHAWSSWKSPDRDNWRAHIGYEWIGASADTVAHGFGTSIVAGDDSSGVLWMLDPSVGRDDRTTAGDDAFTRIVTGGVQVTGRDVADCGAVTIDLALGNPSQTGASILLEISDDLGHSWLNCGSIVVASGDYSPVVEWRSLGQMHAPGRLFRFTDDGATVRISGANLR